MRLQQYHTIGYRYGFCPITYTSDIIDPIIQSEADLNQPVTSDVGLFYDSTNPSLVIMPQIAPSRPHYISFDDTDPAGPWFPRRPDWASGLVNAKNDPNFIRGFVAAETVSDSLQPDAAEDLTNVMTALQGVEFTAEVRNVLTTQYPFGLWDTTVPGCDFSGVPTVGSFTGANQPQWIAAASPPLPATAPVYMATPGAAIFTTVCFNCHGINADSKGLLADEITDLTGGDARVANFRDGLLGPTSAPGTAREAVFGPSATTLGITTDDLTARYMAWMALGGTQKHLPQDVLAEVSASPVLGRQRRHITVDGTADMLKLGLTLCEQIMDADPRSTTEFSLGGLVASGRIDWSGVAGLIDTNGDAEMWLRLCNLGNRQVVRVVQPSGGWTAATNPGDLSATKFELYWATDANGNDVTDPGGMDLYGPNPVMDQAGNVRTGVTTDNLFPVCVVKPTDPTQLQYATTALAAQPHVIPFCPAGFAQASNKLLIDPDTGETVEGRQWAARGAINAALAVFLYLDGVEHNPASRQPLYTQCNLIGTGK